MYLPHVNSTSRGGFTVRLLSFDPDHELFSAGAPCEEAVNGIRFKIRKMLELGLHPDTPDIEAQQALKNAQRLLTKHNLEQVRNHVNCITATFPNLTCV